MTTPRKSSKVVPGEVAGALSGYFGVAVGHPAIAKLLEMVLPDVERASAKDPAAWKSFMPSVVAKYESAAKALGLTISPEAQQLLMLAKANRTDASYAAALKGLEALGGRLPAATSGRGDYQRVLSSTGAADKAAGINSTDLAILQGQFGRDAVALAMRQVTEMGLSGRQNVAFAAEFRDLSGALQSGNMDQAWALYNSEKDPEKKKRMLQFIQNAIEATSKRLDRATAHLPKSEAERVKRVFEDYRRDPNNPEFRKAYEQLQRQYEDKREIAAALRVGKEGTDRLNAAKKEMEEQKADKADANAVKTEEKVAKQDSLKTAQAANQKADATKQNSKARALAALD